MKKLLALATAFICFTAALAASAYAKTAGSYVSLDAVNTHGRFYERYSDSLTGGNMVHLRPSYKEKDAYGAGLSYRYAFNHDNLFIAPGVFAEWNNLQIKDRDRREMEVQSRFGAKVDLGYDITDNFAAYLTGGYSGVYYRATNYTFSGLTPASISYRTTNGVAGDWVYGLGFKADLNKEFSILLEYNRQRFAAREKIPADFGGYKGTYKTQLDVIKLGLAYNF